MFQPVKVIVHHIRRKVIVYRHTHIHTLTRHINTDYDGPEVNGNGRIIVTEPQYTDMIGPPESPVEVALEWNGENWVLPADALTKGNYIIRDDEVYRYTEGTLSFDDNNAIDSGVTTQAESLESLPTIANGFPLSKDETFIGALTPSPTKS